MVDECGAAGLSVNCGLIGPVRLSPPEFSEAIVSLSGRTASSRLNAAADRRRRMLILRACRTQTGSQPELAIPGELAESAVVDDAGDSAGEGFSLDSVITAPAEMESGEVIFAPARSDRPLARSAERIRDLLDDPAPRTWLFTGDSLGFDVRMAGRSWAEHFGDVIRTRLNRKLDVVLDSTMSDGLLTGLRQDAEWRVLRFQPDVVVITPGLADVSLGPGHREDFRSTLEELVLFLQDEGCMVILSTPPSVFPPAGATIQDVYDLPAYAGLIRDVARKCDIVLADHFARWQVTLRQNGTLGDLLDNSGLRPSRTGHRKLAGHLLRTLGVQLQ